MSGLSRQFKHAIKKLLTSDSLDEIFRMAQSIPVTPEGNLEFSAFQNRVFEDIFPDFTYEFCATSQIKLSEKGDILDIITVSWNLPDESLASYMQNSHFDELSPMVYANPGRALNYTHVMRAERVEEHPFFINHCLKYGINHAMSVGFLNPGHESTFLSFDYLGDKNNVDWIQFDHIKIELASFPFALAWLYRSGVFDELRLKKMFLLLSGLTESRLLNLRKYINSPLLSFDQQASDLGITASTLKGDLASIRDQTILKLGLKTDPNRNTPTRLLDQHYGFLSLLGDHTAELIDDRP
ncbi:MAG: hypothetical protein ABJN22_09725 [Litorimonas sp.]